MPYILKTREFSDTLYLQWEEPKDFWLVNICPWLAELFPHRFRYFVFREDRENAAVFPDRVKRVMKKRAKRYLEDIGVWPHIELEPL